MEAAGVDVGVADVRGRVVHRADQQRWWRRRSVIRARALLRVLTLIGLAGVAAVLSLRFAGPVEGDVGPGRVALAARADASPRTELLLPPLGSVSAATHGAPVTLSARVEQVDLGEIQDVIGSSSIEQRLRTDIEGDLRPLARQLFLRCVVIAAIVGALVGLVVPHRHLRTVLIGAVSGLVSASVVVWAAWTTFDAEAFAEPQFNGPLSEAPRVLDTVRQYVEDVDAVRGRVEVLSAQISDLYATALTETLADGPGRQRILHVSDVHLNPLGVEVTRQLAERFDVGAVLDTGDVTSFGHPVEAEFGALLDDVGVPYFIVPGNHDSVGNRTALARFDNVTVLDGDTVDIAGISVLGVGHPVFTADNRLPDTEIDDAVTAQAEEVERLVRQDGPDILAVHDPAQAQASLGAVDLVLAGHVHRRTWTVDAGTLVLTVGSTGATGLGAFTVDADLAYEAAVLYFEDGELVAVDNIAMHGTDGDFRIDRRLVRPQPED